MEKEKTVETKLEGPSPEFQAKSSKQSPTVFTIFGGTGDLAKKKLLPALYKLAADRLLPEDFCLIGVSRQELTRAQYQALVKNAIQKAISSEFQENVWARLSDQIYYVTGSLENSVPYEEVDNFTKEFEQRASSTIVQVYYLSLPPSLYKTVLSKLKKPSFDARKRRVIFEKPFGHDLESAQELNRDTSQCLDEREVFRIDHYLGKETVQNILVFRFGNSIFEPIWNRQYISHVEITMAETASIQGRGRFYEENGVIRDVIQNHVLQLLALVGMEAPPTFKADDIRDERVKLLKTLRPLAPQELRENLVLGQYEGYQKEENVSSQSRIPTYAALRVFLDNWRWEGVPFYLRSGKNLARRTTQVIIHFRKIPKCLFTEDEICATIPQNRLILRIQPDEGIHLRFASKVPGQELQIAPVLMDFCYKSTFNKKPPLAYEHLLLDAIEGDPTLFIRQDTIEASWRFVDPVLRETENSSNYHVFSYSPGSWGPKEANQLLEKNGHQWTMPQFREKA